MKKAIAVSMFAFATATCAFAAPDERSGLTRGPSEHALESMSQRALEVRAGTNPLIRVKPATPATPAVPATPATRGSSNGPATPATRGTPATPATPAVPPTPRGPSK